MEYTNVRYLRRVNLGDYQHEELEATVGVTEGENPTDVMNRLRFEVQDVLGLKPKKVEVSKPVNTPAPKVEVEPVVEEVEPVVEEVKPVVEEVKPVVEEVKPVVEEVKEPKKAPVKKKAPAKKKAPKTTPYDRENKLHKDEFAVILNRDCKGWKTSEETKAKAKALSVSLDGVAMFDRGGDILASFTAQIISEMDMTDDL